MLSLLFNPSGRISQWDFWRGSFVLIALGFVLDLTDLVDSVPDNLMLVFFFALLYPWLCLLFKRLRSGKKSVWWAIVYVLAFITFQICIFLLVVSVFSSDFFSVFADWANDQISEADYQRYSDEMIMKITAPLALGTAFIALVIVWLVNKITPEMVVETLGDVFD